MMRKRACLRSKELDRERQELRYNLAEKRSSSGARRDEAESGLLHNGLSTGHQPCVGGHLKSIAWAMESLLSCFVLVSVACRRIGGSHATFFSFCLCFQHCGCKTTFSSYEVVCALSAASGRLWPRSYTLRCAATPAWRLS